MFTMYVVFTMFTMYAMFLSCSGSQKLSYSIFSGVLTLSRPRGNLTPTPHPRRHMVKILY